MFLTLLMLTTALAAPPQHAQGPGWTWTLYESNGLTLAQEVPDTDRLNVTFECDPGSNVATLTLYQPGERLAAFAQVQSGDVIASVQTGQATGRDARLNLRTDHPVMAAFAANGELSVTSGEARYRVQLRQPHRAKLRRFVELCNG